MTASNDKTTTEPEARQVYRKPVVRLFGRVAELTAAGSGTLTEATPGGQVNCSPTKFYVPDPTGQCT